MFWFPEANSTPLCLNLGCKTNNADGGRNFIQCYYKQSWQTVKGYIYIYHILNHCIQINSASCSDLYFSRLKAEVSLLEALSNFKSGNINVH